MKKLILYIFLIIFSINQSISYASYEQTWAINEPMRFNITYLPGGQLQLKNGIIQKPLFTPYFAPDITNIKLSGLLDLGFDLPHVENAEDCNLYLKLYNLPKEIPNKPISDKFLDDFALSFGNIFPDIGAYIAKPQNITVKMAFIAKSDSNFTTKNPIPKFITAKNKEFISYFSNNIPFYSIYLSPTAKLPKKASQDDIVNWSRTGVTGFEKDLISSYKQNYCELDGVDKNYYYFWGSMIKNKKITIMKIPKTLITLNNWKDFPMSQNPKHVFLTSLLPIYSIEYISKSTIPSIIPQVDSTEFNETFEKGATKVFEVGSVVKIN